MLWGRFPIWRLVTRLLGLGQDLGETYLDQISQTRTVANLKRRIERLGYQVTLEPKAQAA